MGDLWRNRDSRFLISNSRGKVMSKVEAVGPDNALAELGIELDELRCAIQEEYGAVATTPGQGFHFHTGRHLASILGYLDEWLVGVPEKSIERFAGTGNPFRIGELSPGERVVDVGCGAGIDSLIAAKKVGSSGQVIGVDMTDAMLENARSAAQHSSFDNVEFRKAYAEGLPVTDGWADVVISNGVLNLTPDKSSTLGEMARVLKPTGRLQIADILVQKAVPEGAKRKIDLWTG
jgi:SAM-dependent methyltransferase